MNWFLEYERENCRKEIFIRKRNQLNKYIWNGSVSAKINYYILFFLTSLPNKCSLKNTSQREQVNLSSKEKKLVNQTLLNTNQVCLNWSKQLFKSKLYRGENSFMVNFRSFYTCNKPKIVVLWCFRFWYNKIWYNINAISAITQHFPSNCWPIYRSTP